MLDVFDSPIAALSSGERSREFAVVQPFDLSAKCVFLSMHRSFYDTEAMLLTEAFSQDSDWRGAIAPCFQIACVETSHGDVI